MIGNDDLEWLAGLCDAEACFQTGMNKSRRDNVVATFQIGLVRHDVVEQARDLIAEIVGEAVPGIHVRPATATQREFYSVTVAAKHQALKIAEALCPRLHGKRAEALASADILRRAAAGRHAATERDRELCELSRRIKKGDVVAAKDRVAELLGVSLATSDPTTAWLAGMLDGDGSIYVACQTRGDAHYYDPNVNISSSDRPAIESMREVVARTYAVTALAVQKVKGGARSSYGFTIAVDDTERFLTALRPHLRVKAAEADVMIDACRGKTSREDAYGILRALKQADDPNALLEKIAAGGKVPSKPKRVSRMEQYRRPTYEEMKQRGWWSSDEAREKLGGVGHRVWMIVIEGFTPNGEIGNKKYYAPKMLREHVTARLVAVIRTDARDRMRFAMESWT